MIYTNLIKWNQINFNQAEKWFEILGAIVSIFFILLLFLFYFYQLNYYKAMIKK